MAKWTLLTPITYKGTVFVAGQVFDDAKAGIDVAGMRTAGARFAEDATGPATDVVIVGGIAFPLPTGAATAAKQDTGNTSLADIDISTAAINGKLPATVASTAKQDTGNASLASIDGKLPAAAAVASGDALPTTTTIAALARFLNAARTGLEVGQSGLKAAVSTFLGFANVLGYGIYNATPPTLTDGQGVALQADSQGSLRHTLATLIAGEDLANNVLRVRPPATSDSTDAWTNSVAKVASGTTVIKASAGRLRKLRILNIHATAAQYAYVCNKASAPVSGDAFVDLEYVPSIAQATAGIGPMVEIDYGPEGKYFSAGISIAEQAVPTGTTVVGTPSGTDLIVIAMYQ